MDGKLCYIPTFCSKVCRILRYPLVSKTHRRIHFILKRKLNIVRISERPVPSELGQPRLLCQWRKNYALSFRRWERDKGGGEQGVSRDGARGLSRPGCF